ncbi:MAG: DNA-binding MarR family transcriptional regulator [Polaribacter sp.]|jgi:DNA-binding MarR family transcriptional regulator
MSSTVKVPIDDPSDSFGFVIERTAKRMKQYYQKMLRDAHIDITVDQWILLKAIYKKDGSSQYEIASSTFKDAPTVTRILDILSTKGLIERVADSVDRRKFNIRITKKGKEQVKQISPVVQSFRETSWNGLTKKQLGEMTNLLNVVFDNLDKKSEK